MEEVTVAYEEWGPVDGPVIVVLPSFSMGSHARSSPENPARGWWEPMIGPGKSIDTNKYRVICASSLGAPFGTTCPLSVNPATPGMSYGGKFPQITPHDMSSVHARLLREHLGLKKVFAVVGGSLGGMLALHLIVDYPGFAQKCVSLAATGRSTPGTVALRSAQRSLLEADPAYRGGDYDPKDPPKEGMKQARKLGMMFYRSRQEFDDKFGWKADKDHKFEVEAYLQKAGDTFAGKFDPNCWMLLSRGMDLMDVGRPYQDSFDRALKRVRSDCLFVAFTHDRLIPAHEMRDVVEKLRANEEKEQMIEFHEHPSIYGHDAFLKEFKWMNEHMSVFFGDKAEVDPANLQ